MASKKDNILQFNQYMKSDKMPYIIYADLESMITKTDRCASNLEKSSTTKLGEHVSCGYSMPIIWEFDTIKNKHSLSRGEDYMKKFCSSLREHATNVINLRRRKYYR